MSIVSVMSSNHLILCRPLCLLLSIFPRIRVFSNELILRIRWPKILEFQLQLQTLPMNTQDWFPLGWIGWISLLSKGLPRVFFNTTVQKVFGYAQKTCIMKVAQSCPALCDPMELYNPWDSPGQNTGVGSCSLLQGIFPTHGLNPGLPHCRWILYQLNHQGSPRILAWVAHPCSSGSFQPRNQIRVSCIEGGFFTSWATREHALDTCLNWFKHEFELIIWIVNIYKIWKLHYSQLCTIMMTKLGFNLNWNARVHSFLFWFFFFFLIILGGKLTKRFKIYRNKYCFCNYSLVVVLLFFLSSFLPFTSHSPQRSSFLFYSNCCYSLFD